MTCERFVTKFLKEFFKKYLLVNEKPETELEPNSGPSFNIPKLEPTRVTENNSTANSLYNSLFCIPLGSNPGHFPALDVHG